MNRDFKYEKNNIIHPSEDIKCKNYIICKDILPPWWFECKGNYLCTNCHMMFGTWGKGKDRHYGKGALTISQDKCLLCLKNKECISQPRCDHLLCINCFKKCYYRDEESEDESKSEDENLGKCPICYK